MPRFLVFAKVFSRGTLPSGTDEMADAPQPRSVRRQDRLGSIERGKPADVAEVDIPDYREIPDFAAVNFCVATFKRGDLVWSANESTCGVRAEFQ